MKLFSWPVALAVMGLSTLSCAPIPIPVPRVITIPLCTLDSYREKGETERITVTDQMQFPPTTRHVSVGAVTTVDAPDFDCIAHQLTRQLTASGEDMKMIDVKKINTNSSVLFMEFYLIKIHIILQINIGAVNVLSNIS